MSARWLVAVLLAVACGHGGAEPHRLGWRERGQASWYGPGFHGRFTANGERYDMDALTAAHKTLPFGTLVEVENLDNGRRVTVRITDRGPFVRGRIIDLSREAASRIGMIGTGTARVELVVVGFAATSDSRSAVQLGAFRDAARARTLADRLERNGWAVSVDSGDGWHRVRSRCLDRDEAARLQADLVRAGEPGVLVPCD